VLLVRTVLTLTCLRSELPHSGTGGTHAVRIPRVLGVVASGWDGCLGDVCTSLTANFLVAPSSTASTASAGIDKYNANDHCNDHHQGGDDQAAFAGHGPLTFLVSSTGSNSPSDRTDHPPTIVHAR
jgi:hypothetical protein